MNERVTQLENQVQFLLAELAAQRSSNTIPLPLDQSLVGRGFLKTASIPLPGAHTYYVAVSSGGLVTTAITITDGLQTA